MSASPHPRFEEVTVLLIDLGRVFEQLLRGWVGGDPIEFIPALTNLAEVDLGVDLFRYASKVLQRMYLRLRDGTREARERLLLDRMVDHDLPLQVRVRGEEGLLVVGGRRCSELRGRRRGSG